MYELAEVVEALGDARMVNALERALRDARIRRRFRRLREGITVAEALLKLSEEFYLSEERIRTIVYRKGM